MQTKARPAGDSTIWRWPAAEHRGPRPVWLNGEAIGLGAVLLLALTVRLVALGSIPGNVTADEADNLQVAYHVRFGTGPGFFGFDWKPQPMFSVWLMTQVMHVVGWTIFGMRFTSAVLSVAALVPFYLLARRQVDRPAALGATVLLGSGLWYLNFSRSGWENVHTALYGLGAAYCLLRGLETGRLRYWVAAGVFCALGLYGYFSGRMIAVGLLAFFPFALLQRRAAWRPVLAGYAVMLAVAAALFAPQAVVIRDRWEQFNGRTRAVFVLREARGLDQAREVLARQASTVARAFLLFDPSLGYNARYNAQGQGMLDRATAGLYLLGLVVSLWRWRDTALWWCIFLVGLVSTQLLAEGAPDGARAVGFAPFMYLFAALGLHTLARPLPARFRPVSIGLACLAIAAWNVNGYLEWINRPETLNARKPAVELADFEAWQEAQMAEARAGRGGFNVSEWMSRRAAAAQRGQPGPGLEQSAPGQAASANPVPANLPRRGAALGVLGAGGPLVEPRGVAVDSGGSILVADARSAQIVRIGPDGAVQGTWRVEPFGQEASEPWDLAVDAGDNVWVLDAVGGVVRRYGPDGQPRATIGQDLGLYRPRGIAVDADGQLYIADTGHHRVLKLDPNGRPLLIVGGGAASFIQQPSDVAVGPDRSLYVAEPEAGRLHLLDPQGRPVAAVASDRTSTIDAPHLAFDLRLNALVATDPPKGRVVAYRPDLSPIGFLDGVKEGPQPLEAPTGVAVRQGRAFVAEARRGRVVLYDLIGLGP